VERSLAVLPPAKPRPGLLTPQRQIPRVLKEGEVLPGTTPRRRRPTHRLLDLALLRPARARRALPTGRDA